VDAFRKKPLPRRLFAASLDALFLKLQHPGKGIEKQVLYAALGLTEDGRRILLGFWLFPNEGAFVWEELLKELWARGLVDVLLFVADGLAGVEEAIHRVYPRAEWQYSILHKLRAAQAQVKRRDAAAVLADLKRVYRASNRAKALEELRRFTRAWQDRYPRLASSWQNDSGALLRFYDYPEPLWRYLKSTNLIEQFFRELRRSTKVRDHKFPRPESVYKLVYLESERREGRWNRRLPGFAEAAEDIEALFKARYPVTQGLTQEGWRSPIRVNGSLSLICSIGRRSGSWRAILAVTFQDVVHRVDGRGAPFRRPEAVDSARPPVGAVAAKPPEGSCLPGGGM